MLISIVPVVAAILGLLIYALAANPKVSETGRLLMFAGMLVTLFVMAGQSVRI